MKKYSPLIFNSKAIKPKSTISQAINRYEFLIFGQGLVFFSSLLDNPIGKRDF